MPTKRFKPSTDPVQNELRKHKAEWNYSVSEFIDNLIHLKKMMNGIPSKFNMERASIGEPLPKDPASVLGVLAADFNGIATDGNQIISEQLQYSKSRRRKKPQQLNLPSVSTAPQSPEASKQLSLPSAASLQEDFSLQVLSSGKLSRLWFKALPFRKNKEERLALMKSCLKIKEDIEKAQLEILGKGKESVQTTLILINSIIRKISIMEVTINAGKTALSEELKKQIDYPKAEAAMKDFVGNRPNLALPRVKANKDLLMSMSNIIKLIKESEEEDKPKLILSFLDQYNGLLMSLNKEHQLSESSLEGITKAIFTQKETVEPKPESEPAESKPANSEDLESKAAVKDDLKQLWRKTKHFLKPDETSSVRKLVYKKIKQSKYKLNELMNSLEKGFFPDELSLKYNELKDLLSQAKQLLLPIHQALRVPLNLDIESFPEEEERMVARRVQRSNRAKLLKELGGD